MKYLIDPVIKLPDGQIANAVIEKDDGRAILAHAVQITAYPRSGGELYQPLPIKPEVEAPGNWRSNIARVI